MQNVSRSPQVLDKKYSFLKLNSNFEIRILVYPRKAILFSAIEKLLDGTCQPYVNQYMHDPKLAKSAQVQVTHFVNQIAKIRNDESSARILLKVLVSRQQASVDF